MTPSTASKGWTKLTDFYGLHDGQDVGVTEEAKKVEGMAAAAHTGKNYLTIARAAATNLALLNPDHTTDADEVRQHLERIGISLPWANWAGSLFKTDEWIFSGYWVQCKHAGGHCRMIRRWKLRKEVVG